MSFHKILLTTCISITALTSIALAHKPWVALTFDDGPSPDTTEKILDILDQNHIHATFFMIGKNVQKYPDLVKHIVASGNAIGNHTRDHTNLTNLSFAGVQDQIRKTQNVIKEAVGFAPVMFRPPYGAENAKVIKAAGLASVQWSIDTHDREGLSEDAFLHNATDRLSPGSILLMHDRVLSTPDYLPDLITLIRQKGYAFATIPMFYGGSKNMRAGMVYHRQ